MHAYYNDSDPFCAQWLRNLIAAGAIPAGEVDERSIADIKPSDLAGYRHVHFFAGIGGWAYALQLAGWPADRPVWTGSCPCQPFSSAGRRKGADDSRHLWPVWFRLIRECRPAIIFGEQVASADVIGRQGEETAAALRDLGSQAEPGLSSGAPREGESEEEENRLRSGFLHHGNTEADQYRDLRSDWPAVEPRRWAHLGQSLSRPDQSERPVPLFEFAGGLPCDQQRHGRLGRAALDPISLGDLGEEKGEVERLIAAVGEQFDGQVEWAWLDRVRSDLEGIGYTFGAAVLGAHSVGAPHIRQRLFWVADADAAGSDRQRRQGLSGDGDAPQRDDADGRGEARGMGNAHGERPQGRANGSVAAQGWDTPGRQAGLPSGGLGDAAGEQMGRARQPWQDSVWLPCLDGKARRVEPEIQPLATGIPNRVGLLRGSGNAITPQTAALFIEAVMAAIRG